MLSFCFIRVTYIIKTFIQLKFFGVTFFEFGFQFTILITLLVSAKRKEKTTIGKQKII